MPADFPSAYFDAENRFREARTPREKITRLEEMLTIIPRHNGTDKLRAKLRRRISRLKDASQSKKGATKVEPAIPIHREGAAQGVVVSPTNVGKSSLVAALTHAVPQAAAAPNTTCRPTPGMMPEDHIQTQLVDTPPIAVEIL